MKNMKQKSMKLNMMFNVLNGLMNIIFPLITFPYISKTLGVEELGKVNFSASVIDYFILFAGLGISAYGIREGARIREDKERINKFVSELFSINLLTTIVSYIFLFLTIFSVSKFHPYLLILLIYSIQIVFITIGVDWILTIYEDFCWMTIRKFIIKVFSLVMMFLFVRTPRDTVIYVLIIVFADAGGYLLNFIYSKKYCKFRITIKIDWKRHINPILTLFATAVSVSIFVNSDTTMLGLICGDKEVGIYAITTKIYMIVKTILSSVIVAAVPRLSAALADGDKNRYEIIANDVFKTLMTVVFPAVVGIIILRREIVLIVGDETYLDAQIPLLILGVALLASLFSWFWAQCVLVPNRREKLVLVSNIVSAIVNVALNIILMPYWGASAAAFTTLISEIICCVWAWIIGIRYCQIQKLVFTVVKVLTGCISFMAVIFGLRFLNLNYVLYTLVAVAVSIPIYFGIEIIVKNETVYEIFKLVPKKFRRIKN